MMRNHVRLTVLLLLLVLLLAFVISVATGYVSLTPAQLLRTIADRGSEQEELILFTFRLPRIVVTMLAGMGLALAGAILQSVTRNPLSDPGILGINAGAGLAVVLYVMYFSSDASSFLYVLPLFALLGGLLAIAVIYLFSYKRGEGIQPTRLILVGVGLAAAINGMIFTLTARLADEQNAFIANWIAGKIWGDDWVFVFALLPWMLVLTPIVFAKAAVLDLLQLEEKVSIGLGVHVERERKGLLVLAVALATAAVSVSGGIAFIGLMAPHIARSLVGVKHRSMLPVATLLGAILLLLADTIGRSLLDPSGIPAGIIVTVLGTPYFLYLLVEK